MKERKIGRLLDVFLVLAMIAAVVVFCHPIGRDWSEEEIERYMGVDGEYSPDVDSFYYLRKAKEFSEGGIGSIRLIAYRTGDAKCTTGDAIAREANGAMPMLLPASAALVWYGLRALGIRVGIYALTIRFCSFLLALFVIPVYIFLRKRTSRTAAVLGGLLVALEVPFFRHAHVGFFDTDAMIGLMALTLILSLYECCVAKTRKAQAIYGATAFLAMILLRFTWTAFFIYGAIAVGTALVGIIAVRLRGRFDETRKKAFRIPAAVLAAITLASLVLGWNSFVSLAKGFVSPSGSAGDWPSETMNISELQSVPLSDADSFWYHFVTVGRDLTSVTGGAFALSLLIVSAVICVVWFIRLIRSRSEDTENVFLLAALLTWLFGSAFLAFFGMRYMEFVTLPSAIVAGFGFHRIAGFCRERSVSGKRVLFVFVGIMAFCGLLLRFPTAAVIAAAVTFAAGWFLAKQKSGALLVTALAAAILAPIGISCVVVCAQEVPYIERPMEDAMIWVRENTEPDAVLADFWNLGYIYQYYGERRTIADGGTYNGQFFYWLANMMVTDDARLSAGIARMLQNCGIDGSEYAQEVTGSAEKARTLLWEILPVSRQDAEAKLRNEYAFTEGQASRLLDYTHPAECPDIYFTASHNTFELVSSLVARYRDWTGETKAELATYYSMRAVAHPGEDPVYSPLTYGENEPSGLYVAVAQDGEALNGWIVAQDGSPVECGRRVYIRDGEVVYDRSFTAPSEGYGFADDAALMLLEENGTVSAVMAEKGSAYSVIVNLFLLNGMNQDVFEKVYDSGAKRGTDSVQGHLDDSSAIIIWKVKTE